MNKVNFSSIMSHHTKTDNDMPQTKYTTYMYIIQVVFSMHLQLQHAKREHFANYLYLLQL